MNACLLDPRKISTSCSFPHAEAARTRFYFQRDVPERFNITVLVMCDGGGRIETATTVEMVHRTDIITDVLHDLTQKACTKLGIIMDDNTVVTILVLVHNGNKVVPVCSQFRAGSFSQTSV